jgi:hypothetical protein
MNQMRRIIFRNSALKPSLGFQALNDANIRTEVASFANPKLDAVAEVLQSLSNAEVEYLNALITERSLKDNRSVLFNKIVNSSGYAVDPISYAYQQSWVAGQWKETNLL